MKRIADIGSSAVSRLEVDVKGSEMLYIHAYDIKEHEGVEQQDMENLTLPDDFYDIVHCRNALDHTKNAEKAVLELIRICKPGGLVFIKCWLDQKDTGGKHYWNAKEDGVFENGATKFDLVDYGFKIWYVDHGGERRYNFIEATLVKP